MKTVRGDAAAREQWLGRLVKKRGSGVAKAKRTASRIIERVRLDGDRAVARCLEAFDRVSVAPDSIRITPRATQFDGRDELEMAIALAIRNVEAFHAPQITNGYRVVRDGLSLQHRVKPFDRVGIYVPGGRAVYLSTLIMCAVPARLAGVRDLVVATTPNAAHRPELHLVCERLGIREIYGAGGAAGIAAMAIGTESLRRVDKIVGPGNAWVTAAKQLLWGEVSADMTAGPTEIVVIADESANVVYIAADLLAQAEHGPDSACICITDSAKVARSVAREVKRQLAEVPPESAAHAAIRRNGTIIVVESIDEAISFTERIGPEHVSVMTIDAMGVAERVRGCGAVFAGAYSAVAAGDYTAGTNHVLPTGGSARSFSPLGAYDFVKRTNVISIDEKGLGEIASATERMARFEGLPLHARSIEVRSEKK